MPTVLDGNSLTIEDVVRVARKNERVELAAGSVEAIKRCRTMIERKIEAREIMYGINTGIGELAEVVLDDEQVREFQRYLIYNHAAGIGEPLDTDIVRAAMVSRVNVHAKGLSGCRIEIPQTYISMLNAGVTPVVCEKGSVGACGDLAPMSQIALSLMGEGESFYRGERMPTAHALEQAGIPVPGLKARDGLSAINGSNVITAI
ncbi:MAG: aromatic amino acid ammonia-lyase, partial [Acidobacteriota bacterium]|nr:aromatic amino acid ammonia-lyase [Acidobacteriota bacterium]